MEASDIPAVFLATAMQLAAQLEQEEELPNPHLAAIVAEVDGEAAERGRRPYKTAGSFSPPQARRLVRKRKAAQGLPALPPGQRRRLIPGVGHKAQRRGVSYFEGKDPASINLYELTGLTTAEFLYVYGRVKDALRVAHNNRGRKIKRYFNKKTELLVVLFWLRKYHTEKEIADKFGCSEATVSRVIHFVLPKLHAILQSEIRWPDGDVPAFLLGASGAIDCSSHLRWRVHPWQSDFYCGDKGVHFMTAQLIVALAGRPWDLQLGLGHNNDQAMYGMTDMDYKLAQRGILCLADGGYHGAQLITPLDALRAGVQKEHAGARSVVEQFFAYVHWYQAATQVFRESPETQEHALITIYALCAIKCRNSPLRPEYTRA